MNLEVGGSIRKQTNKQKTIFSSARAYENLFLFWLLWVRTPRVSFWLFGLNEFQNETRPIVKFSPNFSFKNWRLSYSIGCDY